ncbi:class IV adenylate cyclase [Streptomyces niveiscabiei]|uniref:class IV adenylate cyclase n=1 Tax=Streptomyces niveiscabiei TaxID=164115 RepID=UPI0029A2DBD4|nr:class IV adenylate cyclase [Streptomyces niveiscabiei]MDX3384367.1 class IV adenylate cyclase [Streptomyces niveiscabiei]
MSTVHGQIEVERKRQLPADGRTGIVEALAESGWTADAPVTEVDTYYSRPDVDYMETVECLRVRRRGDFAEITYKPASGTETSGDGVIAKRETNVEVGGAQADQADLLLESIGMRLLVRVEKHRTTYRHPLYPDASVSIDLLAGVGDYVETEVMSPDQEAAAATLKDVEEQIGVTDLPVVDLPYRDLVLAR